MVQSFIYSDQILWPIYITIKSLNAKILIPQKRPKKLLFGSIFIIHKQSEDANNKNKDLKAKIYYMTLKTILQRIYSSFSFINFKEMRC